MKRATPVFLAALAMLIAACGGDAGDTTTGETSTTISVDATTTTTLDATTTTTQPTTTSAPATITTTAPEPTATLAGEPIDFGPARGDMLMVVGVAHDDALNLRAAPGRDQPIRDEIPPTSTGLIAQGSTRDLSPGFWIEVAHDGTRGWVHMSFVAYEGVVTDETSTVVTELGARPVEPTMPELGELVASVFATDGDPESAIVQVTPVSTGDLAEVTFDVIGLGDDAVLGFRLHVFAEEVAGGVSLRSVEVTTLCGRGATEERLCA